MPSRAHHNASPLPCAPVVTVLAALALLAAPAPASAQPDPAGPPFQVSQAGVSTTPAPVVAVGPRGEAVFLWIGECPDFGLCARAHGETGAPLGDAAPVATSSDLFDAVPAAVVGADGLLTLVWSRSGAGFEREIAGRRFLLDGTPVGAEFVVAARSAQVYDAPSVALTPGGDLLVAFEKLRFDGTLGEGEEQVPVYTGVEILARRLAPDGTPRGEVFRVDGPSADVVGAPVAAAAPGDGAETYLFAWESFDFLSGRDDVLVRRFTAAGDGTAAPDADEAAAAPPSPEIRRAPTAAGVPQGNFLVAWEVDGASPVVRAQVYDDAGAIFPFPFEVGQGAGVGNTTGGNRVPRADGGDGHFALVWENTAGAVFARRYDVDGIPLEPFFRVDAAAEGTPLHPDAGVFGGPGTLGGLVVGWALQEPDFDRRILARRYPGLVPLPPPCTEDATTLCLNDGRFEVKTVWATTQGTSGSGQAGDELTDDTGYFWFFNEANVEVIVKVLDGCAVNDRYWVFAAGLTNVQVTMTVRDTATATAIPRTYLNPQNTPFQPIQDTDAFPCP